MKVKVIHEERKIPIADIAEELKKANIVDRFEYGDYDNWVTAILKEVTVDGVKELGPKATSKYIVTIKSVWNCIRYDGTVSEREDTGYSVKYTNDPNNFEVKIYGYAVEEGEVNK